MKPRNFPYIWVTWLTPLLAGEQSCEFKVWLRAHYQDVKMRERDFDMAEWNANHTALLNQVREKYLKECKQVLTEGQTSWKLQGKTATLAGKMDLLTAEPNYVIDVKSGKRKDSHVIQVQLYMLALKLRVLPQHGTEFQGILEYPEGDPVIVPAFNEVFEERVFRLIKRIASGTKDQVALIPSENECRFCDIVDCEARVSTPATAVQTNAF